MAWYLIVICCLAYSIPGWRLVFRHVYGWNHYTWQNDNAESLMAGLLWATVGFWTWPAWVFIFACAAIADHDPHKFAVMVGGQTRGQKERAAIEERRRLGAGVVDAKEKDRPYDCGKPRCCVCRAVRKSGIEDGRRKQNN